MEAFTRIVDMEEDFYGLVFARTRVDADRIGQALEERGYPVETLHGDYAQEHRDRVMARFRSGKARILVATDVAARGIDVEGLTHVVNWSLPQDSQAYMHRIGRTGRAGNEGTAITFVTPYEYRKLTRMRKGAGASIKKGSVPKVGDVIDARRARAIAKVNSVAEDVSAEGSPWMTLADEILAAADPRVALASCLSLAFAGTLDPERYGKIADVEREERPGRLVDQAGQTRIFVSAGRHSGIDRKRLAEMIRRVSGLPDRSDRRNPGLRCILTGDASPSTRPSASSGNPAAPAASRACGWPRKTAAAKAATGRGPLRRARAAGHGQGARGNPEPDLASRFPPSPKTSHRATIYT